MECPNKQDLSHHYREGEEKISPTSVKKIKFFSHGRQIPSYRLGYQFSELEPCAKKKQGPPEFKLNCSLIDSGFKLRSLQDSDKCFNLPKGTLEVMMEKLTLQKRVFVIEFSSLKASLPLIEATQNSFDFWVRTSVDDEWQLWDSCHRSLKRSLAVKLGSTINLLIFAAIDLTPKNSQQTIFQKLGRWLAEPIDAVFLSVDVLQTLEPKVYEILDHVTNLRF
jgi:hypothetical protein